LDRAGARTRPRHDEDRGMSARPHADGAANRRPTASPRVSVIIPFLDAERFIAEAIESVLAQDFQDFELILVDDGSARTCTDIARDYAARYAPVIRYVDHEQHRNRGISASRNVGMSLAHGELIAFIDADDVWLPTKLREQVAILDARPEVGMVCGAVRYWRSWNGGADTIIQAGHVANTVIEPPEAALALYPLGTAASPSTDLMVRRDVVKAIGGFEEHFVGTPQLYEDQGFLLKLFLTAPVYFSDRIWLHYRQHEGSSMATILREGGYDAARLYFLNWLERYLAARPDADERVRRALRRNLYGYRHPVLNTVRGYASAVVRRGRRVAGRLLGRVSGPAGAEV
jgi:glycosyltransferase involved in cell wall biosynthesis